VKKLILKESELSAIAREIAAMLPEGGVVVMRGELASGKTTLVKAAAKFFGVEDTVTSPTFSLQHCYGENLYHYDIYNHGFEHFLALGMMEELEKNGYHFIEWGDDALIDLLRSAQIPTVVINLKKNEKDKREYGVNYA
jgi:tRNA threonylcarbamoyladenosine biosynthesis protein TsaE